MRVLLHPGKCVVDQEDRIGALYELVLTWNEVSVCGVVDFESCPCTEHGDLGVALHVLVVGGAGKDLEWVGALERDHALRAGPGWVVAIHHAGGDEDEGESVRETDPDGVGVVVGHDVETEWLPTGEHECFVDVKRHVRQEPAELIGTDVVFHGSPLREICCADRASRFARCAGNCGLIHLRKHRRPRGSVAGWPAGGLVAITRAHRCARIWWCRKRRCVRCVSRLCIAVQFSRFEWTPCGRGPPRISLVRGSDRSGADEVQVKSPDSTSLPAAIHHQVHGYFTKLSIHRWRMEPCRFHAAD